MFLQVSVCPLGLSVCPQGGGCPIACCNTHPQVQTQTPQWDQRQTAPRQTPLDPWADTPCDQGQTPHWADTPHRTQCMLGYDQQAGGMHPTAMHSCSDNISHFR